MEVHQLRYFAKVAELGHFTRAAEACHVSQPSLSQAIAKLERELGQPLFVRLGRTVKLTDAGRALKTRAEQILSLLDDAKALLERMIAERWVQANGVVGFWPANSVGDDIELYTGEPRH